MRFLIKNHLENAIEALKANHLRTALTITGVTIGVAGMTAALSLASGATQFLGGQISSASDRVALVRSNSAASAQGSIITDPQALPATSTLTEKDSDDLARIPNATVAPMAILHTDLKTKDGNIAGKNSTLIGSSPALITAADLQLLDGQFLADDNGANSIIVGYQLAIDLFGSEHAIGNTVTIRNQTFTVAGVLKAIKQPINYRGVDFDHSAIIQLAALKKFTQNVAQIQQIIIASSNSQPLTSIIDKASQTLAKNHLGEADFKIITGDELTAPSGQFFDGLTILIAIITGVALLVGGIGIMNIMLVNVAERNREVGIRKAVGAGNGHIINQFLIESAIIGLLGGVSGYLLGLLTAFIVSAHLPFAPLLDWRVAATTIGIAIITGVIFGIYPAVRASKKDPIESLRT